MSALLGADLELVPGLKVVFLYYNSAVAPRLLIMNRKTLLECDLAPVARLRFIAEPGFLHINGHMLDGLPACRSM